MGLVAVHDHDQDARERTTITNWGDGSLTIRTPGQPTTRGYDYGNGYSTFRTPGQPTLRCYSDAYGNTTCR